MKGLLVILGKGGRVWYIGNLTINVTSVGRGWEVLYQKGLGDMVHPHTEWGIEMIECLVPIIRWDIETTD